MSVHEALAVPVRGRILDRLEAQGPQDAHQLAGHLGSHVTTVRFHLQVLAAAGLLTVEKDPRPGPGRPRLRYRSTRRRDPVAGYLMLADTLAAHLGDDPEERGRRAQDAGLAWAAAHPQPVDGDAAGRGLPEAVEQVGRRFAELGFNPEPVPGGAGEHVLAFRTCPYMPVPERHPEVTCSLHHGILRGLFNQLTQPAPRVDLEPFATPDACLVRVTATTPKPVA